jgi:membrane-bound lytic murein transglycosylase A
LRGLELVWLRDRLEAYLVQVQGSARLRLTDGTMMSIGYAGRTDYPYVSIGRELVNDGKFREDELTLPMVIEHFRANPAELNTYLPRNDRFVFFRETRGTPATGSLGVPVTPERSIATDKSLMPPGALALIQTQIPYPDADGTLTSRLVNRYVLDQDTGGAIRGAGRVDIFMGTGELAGDRAGLINTPGELYYLLLKE